MGMGFFRDWYVPQRERSQAKIDGVYVISLLKWVNVPQRDISQAKLEGIHVISRLEWVSVKTM